MLFLLPFGFDRGVFRCFSDSVEDLSGGNEIADHKHADRLKPDKEAGNGIYIVLCKLQPVFQVTIPDDDEQHCKANQCDE